MVPIAAVAILAIANSNIAWAFPDANCVGSLKTLKMALALDCSGSVDQFSWEITIDFAKNFVTKLLTDAPDTEVALEYFDHIDYLIQDFTSDLGLVLTALDTQRCGGGTNFPINLQPLFDNLEADATKMLLLVTDGQMNNIETAGQLKESGVTIFTVGIGNAAPDSLESICSQPPQEFNHLMPDYTQLPIIVNELTNKLTSSVVRYSPSYGPVTGGVYINAYVPMGCLADVDEVHCGIGSHEVRSLDVARRSGNPNIYCLSPVTNQHGSVPFSIILKKGSQVLSLPALQPFEFFDATPVKQGYFDLTIDDSLNSVTLEWGKLDTDLVKSVDLTLQRIEYKDGRADPDVGQMEYLIARDVPVSSIARQDWSGTALDTIPADFEGLEFLQIRQALSTIGTEAIPWPNDGVPYWTGFRERGIAKASIDPTLSPDHSQCQSWHDAELTDTDWYKELEGIPCPPTAFVAILDNDYDTDQSCCDRNIDPQCWLPYAMPWFYGCDKYHDGASHCVVSLPTEGGSRQQCCYGQTGSQAYNLILDYPGGGNAERSSSLTGHYLKDVRPHEWCCADHSSDCHYYYELRKSRNSDGYDKVYPAGGTGDPHFTTLDNFEYTFNGHGEFTLIQSTLVDSDIGFKIQVRLEPMPDQLLEATRSTALAGAFVCNKDPSKQITMSAYFLEDGMRRSNEPAIRVMVNDNIMELDGRPKHKYSWECNGQTYEIAVARGSTSALIQGPGMSLSIYSDFDMLSYIVVVNDIYKENVEGLLGQWNGSPDDDLQPFGSADFLLPTSNLSTIHYDFGLSWNVKKEDSLFVYAGDESYESINDLSYKPILDVPDLSGDEDFANSVKAMCGDNFACIFDASVTGSLEVANASLGFQGQVEDVRPGFLELRNLSEPAAWGFLKSPRHPLHYPDRVNWTLILHKEESDSLAGYENRVGFLRFVTEDHDHVAILATDGNLEANFTGDLQSTSSGPFEASLPIYAGLGPNTTITFQSDSVIGSSGFLLAYASEIPAEWPAHSSAHHQPQQVPEQEKSEMNKLHLGSTNVARKHRKRVEVDMENPRGVSVIRGSSDELIQLDASGTCGFFMSPNHPNEYDDDALVTYEMRAAAADQRVIIFFLRFATEPDWDGLILKDLGTGEEVLYTGDTLPSYMYLSKSNAVEATFISDSSTTRTGFLAAFASISI